MSSNSDDTQTPDLDESHDGFFENSHSEPDETPSLVVDESQDELIEIDNSDPDDTQTSGFNETRDELRKNRIIAGNDNDATTAQYKMLRTQVLRRMKANNWKSLAVTSPGPGEGKTLTSINLAISLARGMNQTVDRKSTRLNSSHVALSRMPSSA